MHGVLKVLHSICIFVSSHMYPENPEGLPSNRRLDENGIYIRHCQESNSQPIPSQVGANPTTVTDSVDCLSKLDYCGWKAVPGLDNTTRKKLVPDRLACKWDICLSFIIHSISFILDPFICSPRFNLLFCHIVCRNKLT